MTSDLETIYAALWSRLTASVTGTVTTSRRVKTTEETQPVQQPAMFLEQISVQTSGETGQPGKQVLVAKVLLYAYTDDDNGPMPAINGLANQVESALKRQAAEGPGGTYTTTLGGIVASARVTAVEFGGGNLGAQGVGIVTITMLTTA